MIGIIDRVLDIADADTISVREVIDQVGEASFAPILLLPAVAVATPLSGIPLFSSLMGIVIMLVSLQMLMRRATLWLPGWVLRRQVKGAAVTKAFRFIYPVAGWLDRHTRKRLGPFVHRPLIFVPQVICVLSGAFMPLLEFVPFSSSIVGAGVALLALGMVTRDGLLMVLAMIPYGLLGWLISRFIAG